MVTAERANEQTDAQRLAATTLIELTRQIEDAAANLRSSVRGLIAGTAQSRMKGLLALTKKADRQIAILFPEGEPEGE